MDGGRLRQRPPARTVHCQHVMKTLGIAVTLAFLAGCTSSARQNAALWGMVALTAAAASEIAEDAAPYCDAYAPHATPCHASAHHHAAHHHAHTCEPGW